MHLNHDIFLSLFERELENRPPHPFYEDIGLRVLIGEEAYGRDLMLENLHIPLLSIVKVLLTSASIQFIEEEVEYFQRYSLIPDYPIEAFLQSLHHQHRNFFFSNVPTDDSSDDSLSQALLLIVDGVGIDICFSHRHYLGGTGVEVSANSFILRAPEEAEDPLQGLTTHSTVKTSDSLLFGPRNAHQVSSDLREDDLLTVTASSSSGIPHIRYSQQGCINYRRCVVSISDSFVSLHVELITRTINYFFNPITFLNERYSLILSYDEMSQIQYEFKGAMDVEVHILNSIVNTPVDTNSKQPEVLCVLLNLDFVNSWRGFVESGPGKVIQSIAVAVHQLFIADVRYRMPESAADSIVESFILKATGELLVRSASSRALSKLNTLQKSMCLPDWSSNGLANSVMGEGYLQYRLSVAIESTSDSEGLDFRLSIKDSLFIIDSIKYIAKRLNSIPYLPTMQSQLSSMLSTYQDMAHLVPVTFYAVHIAHNDEPLLLRKTEISGRVCRLRILIVNNIYNLRIALFNAKFEDFCYVGGVNRSLSGAAEMSISTYNDKLATFEPTVESFHVSTVSLTEVTLIDDKEHYRERVEMKTSSIDFVVNQNMLMSLIKKLSLSDVHISSSTMLPPYTIRNMLGVVVHCLVTLGEANVILESDLEYQKSCDLASSHFGTSATCLLSISFTLDGISFISKMPNEIEAEGLFSFALLPSACDTALEEDNIPIVFLHHVINADGSHDLFIRSALHIKNASNRLVHVSLKHDFLQENVSLAPLEEWFVPIMLAHKRASLFLQMDEKSGWVRAVHHLETLVSKGRWGAPSQLQAQLTECPNLGMSRMRSSSCTLLLKPIALSVNHSTGYVPVRQPTSESVRELGSIHLPTNHKGAERLFDFRSCKPTSLSLLLLAPLVLVNQLCQPILYRFSNGEGVALAEGVLCPCETIDLHNLPRFFEDKYFLSLRLINYKWSSWVCVLGNKRPFQNTEKLLEANLRALELFTEDAEFTLPDLIVQISILENTIRLFTPYWIANRTGFV